MMRIFRAGILVMGLLCVRGARAEPPASGGWFVPPPPAAGSLGAGGQRMDMQTFDGREEITVTAARSPVQRDPRPQETRDFQASHSDAASPSQGSPTQSYCQSAYQTVAGQAATGADMLGMGGGHCD